MEKIKSVPVPIWIGLGLILIVVFVMNSKAGSKQQVSAPVGPVTTATVGTQGAQVGAGTDQQLGNLSVMVQGGFSQIAQQNQAIANQLAGQTNGVGTPMQQFGGSMQAVQNTNAVDNAANGTNGQNAGNNPSTVSTNQ